MTLPSQAYLQSRIDYNPETGEAKWKPVDESYGPRWKVFNSRFAGVALPTDAVRLANIRISTTRVLYKLYYGSDPITAVKLIDGNAENLKISNLESTLKTISYKQTVLIDIRAIPDDVDCYISYNHITGKTTWKPRDTPRSFNAQYAGKEAGADHRGYRVAQVAGYKYFCHRLAWFMYYGVDPGNYFIDHIDRNKTNNSILNLRLANGSFNVQASKQDSTGYIKRNGKYTAIIKINGTVRRLGTYDTEEEATAAYNAALDKYKPIYEFTVEEQSTLDELYKCYPNCSRELQQACHDIHVKAVTHYIDAAVVQGPN
jgi:hypothetical protein